MAAADHLLVPQAAAVAAAAHRTTPAAPRLHEAAAVDLAALHYSLL